MPDERSQHQRLEHENLDIVVGALLSFCYINFSAVNRLQPDFSSPSFSIKYVLYFLTELAAATLTTTF